jgi:dTDP-4-dehydrorhamnose reductase
LSREHVKAATHILFTIPAPNAVAWEKIHAVVTPVILADASSAVDGATTPRSKWIGIVSTTGVYGNHEGSWVTEDSACLCEPNTSAGRLLDFEAHWTQVVAHGQLRARVRIFRCAGIYGNTRSALHTIFRRGYDASDQGQASDSDVTNRIHEEDLATTILSSMLKGDECDCDVQTFNIADDLPESRRTVMDHAARLLQEIGLDVSVGSDGSAMDETGRSTRRGQDRKLVSNKKMKEVLLPALRYPTYREGLSQIVKHPGAPWNLQSPR